MIEHGYISYPSHYTTI